MRIMRLAALFVSVALIVAAIVGYAARRAQLVGERDGEVRHAAELVSARLASLAGIATATAQLIGTDDDAGAAAEALGALTTFDWIVEVDAAEPPPPGGGAVPAIVPTAGPVVIPSVDGSVAVAAVGPSAFVAVTLDAPAVAALARPGGRGLDGVPADLTVAVLTGEVTGPPEGVFGVTAPVTVAGSVIAAVVASVPSAVSLPSEEAWLIRVVLALALVLLLLAGATLLTDARRLVERASIDPLTRLPNRSEFERRGEELLAAAQRSGDGLCLMLFDLDGFKAINDTHGHHAGDRVLAVVGARLRRAVRESDVVARWGGDEFVLVMPGIEDAAAARHRAASLAEVVAEEQLETGLSVGASIGIALFPRHGGTLAELVEAADSAMYAAKRDGVSHRLAGVESSNPAVPFDPAFDRRVSRSG